MARLELLAGLFVAVVRQGGGASVAFRDAVPRMVVLWPDGGDALDVRVNEDVSAFEFGAGLDAVPVGDVQGAVDQVLGALGLGAADPAGPPGPMGSGGGGGS